MSEDVYRRFRDQVVRIAELKGGDPLQIGRVAEQPDTFDFSAKVRIGAKTVKARYFGPPPDVGQQVAVQKNDSSWLLLQNIARPASASGGASVAIPARGAPNSPFINDMGGWGHSYLDTIASADHLSGEQLANRVFSALGISWPHARNYGQGGSQITLDWRTMMRTARPARDNYGGTTWQARFGPQFFVYGANDIGRHCNPLFEGGRFLADWANSWRTAFSWFRSGAIYYPDWIYGGSAGNQGTQAIQDDPIIGFPGGKCGVTYGSGWTLTTDPNYPCVGTTAMQTTASNSSFVLKLPPNFPGTAVTLYFAAAVGQTGSTAGTVTHGGTTPASPVSLVTNERVRATSTYPGYTEVPGCLPVRIVGIPKGDRVTNQTITVNAGTLAGGHSLVFLGWTIEAVHPPLLVPCNVPTPGGWNTSGYLTNGLPGNLTGTYVDSAGIAAHWAGYPNSNGPQTGPAGPTPPRAVPQDADGWCKTSYNPTLATVAGEFAPAGTVAIADCASVLDGSIMPELYGPNDLGQSDALHPNGMGKAIEAVAILTAINRVALDPRHLIAPWDANDSAEAYRMYATT